MRSVALGVCREGLWVETEKLSRKFALHSLYCVER